MQKRITPQIEDQILELYKTLKEDGTHRTQAEVAEIVGFSVASIYIVLKKHNARIGRWQPHKFSDEIEKKIISLYLTQNPDGSYNSAAEIARIFGANTTHIHFILKRNNIKMRGIRETLAHHPACKPIKNLPPNGEKPSLCKCGCDNEVKWNQRKNHWNLYVVGHYRKYAPYKDKDWLYREYVTNHRTFKSIADEFGIGIGTIDKFIKKFRIPKRPIGESLVLSGKARGSNNPAWKGGVAKWDYAFNWKALAHYVRKRDKYTCQSCGLTKQHWGVGLHVHHKDGDKTNNSLDNLISLCAQCHREVHAGRRII